MSEVYAWPALAGGQASFAETREQARSTGYEDGLREGRSAAKAEVEELKNSLKASLRELPAIGGMLDAQQLRDVRTLVLTLTEALIGVELRTNPRVLERLVEEAFQALGVSHAELILRVSEEDAQWLGTSGWIAHRDRAFAPAGCIDRHRPGTGTRIRSLLKTGATPGG